MNNKNNNGFLRNAFLYIIVIIAVVTGVQYFAGGSQSPSQQLSYTQLVKKIEDGKVKSITYQPDGSIIEVKGSYKKAEKVDTDLSLPFLGSASSETRSFTSTVLQNETTMQKLQSASEAADVNVKMIRESSSGAWISYLFSYLPLIGIAIFFLFMMNQGGNRGAMNFGRNRAKTQSKENIKVRFTDVAGAEEEKEELVEVVDFLKNPRKYKALGARIPKGVLLEGPPGTGKTSFVTAFAAEKGIEVFTITPSLVMGDNGERKVLEIIEQAKKAAQISGKLVILLIDEIDAVAQKRSSSSSDKVLVMLMNEIDKLKASDNVVVFATTNRREALDQAIIRSGRLDQSVEVGLPNAEAKEKIMNIYLKNLKVAEGLNTKAFIDKMRGFCGADIKRAIDVAINTAMERQGVENLCDVVVTNADIQEGIATIMDEKTTVY